MTITKEFLEQRPISFSSLKQFIKSPQHYIMYLNQERKPTDSMILGSLIHNMLLEPTTFDSKYIIEPDINKRTNAGKEEFQKFMEDAVAKNLKIVDPKVFIKAKEIVDSFTNSNSFKYLEMMDTKEYRFDRFYNGIPVCGVIDAMSPEYNLEIKTTSSCDLESITRDFYNMKYHLQAAMYQWNNGKPMMYVVLETSAPYLSRVFIASESYMKAGHRLFEKAMNDFAYCLSMEQFDKGYEFYGDELTTLELPGWVKKEEYVNADS